LLNYTPLTVLERPKALPVVGRPGAEQNRDLKRCTESFAYHCVLVSTQVHVGLIKPRRGRRSRAVRGRLPRAVPSIFSFDQA
jgi:hypothetical protein